MVDPAANNPHSASAMLGRLQSLHERRVTWLRNSGMSALLLVLVFCIFVLPVIMGPGTVWRVGSDFMVTLILVSGVAAVSEHRRLAILLIMLSAVAIIARWSEWILPAAAMPIFRDVVTLIALVTLAGSVAINVFASGHALGDRIFGAVLLYLLLGIMCAFGYAMVDMLVPHAFAGQANAGTGITNWFYFSFVTLTTVGYGDITPVANAARSLATLEALAGQLYPAIIIARLVSLPDTSR